MSDLGHPSRALRPYRGQADRHEIHRVGGLPQEGAVAIYELRYSNGTIELEVEASWRGVPVGAPPASADLRPGIAHDTANVGVDAELARALAGVAEDDLRALRTPDLVAARALLRRG